MLVEVDVVCRNSYTSVGDGSAVAVVSEYGGHAGDGVGGDLGAGRAGGEHAGEVRSTACSNGSGRRARSSDGSGNEGGGHASEMRSMAGGGGSAGDGGNCSNEGRGKARG